MNDSAWNALIRDLRNVDDLDVMVSAAERLHRTSSEEDLPRLRALLKDDNFFVREAAAWPLSELAGAVALPELFEAYQRGFDDGHDNDGFSAALIEVAKGDPDGTRKVLSILAGSDQVATRNNATWLLEFCDDGRDV